jgi:Phage integrase, N-terminal SAM-like domain
MSSLGNLQRKCVKGHPKAAGKCSGRCIRWYPRLELPRGPDGTRRFEALGGYPTRAQAEAALADALARRSHGFALDPAKLTVNQYLDRWLDHIRTNRRARTVARYTALLRDHVRPTIGPRPLKQLTPLEVQAVYDRLTISGRRNGKPGGLAPQRILAVHRCLHRALAQAVTWRLVAHNAATHATPPPVPHTEAVALAPAQIAVLLDAAGHTSSPWLGTWTVLAAATGARNGELCGLAWTDLDLDAAPSGSAKPWPSSTLRSSPTRLLATAWLAWVAGARSWPSGRSSLLPATPSSPCHPSRSRRCASTAASRPACVLPAGSPKRSRFDASNPAGYPSRSSWIWCSAPSGARRPTPTTPAAPCRRRRPRPAGVHSPASPRPHLGWPG